MFATETVGSRKFSLETVSTERVVGEAVSANFFFVLHVEPSLGRVLEPQDDNLLGGNHFAVLSHGFWMRRFHSDAAILGKTIFYDEVPYTVVGIAQPGAKRAVMAVAHALLVIAYHMLKRKEDYRELGADHFDRIDVNRIRRSLVNRLERLGHKVTLEPLAQTA
jgi:hypothetical protein